MILSQGSGLLLPRGLLVIQGKGEVSDGERHRERDGV